MASYTPPVRDITFTLKTIADIESIIAAPQFDHVDSDTIEGALDEAARFFSEVFAPTNEIGDEKGATLVDGQVVTPDEFKPVWNKLVDAGWTAVTGSPEYGGHGFPKTFGIAISEMMTSANLAFSLNPMLTGSGITLLTRHGSEELRDLYLSKLISSEWTGTMVLTESEAGSDVGALRTKAEANGDGTYRINGTKIFITWGDHDLTDNVIHMVLARTPGAPPGTRGISLFLVPKFLLNDDGTPGERNTVEVVSIEHKIGIHASPTCVLSFEDAIGYLIGEENHGMRYMFTMMNQARLEVGLEGLSVAERAYQHASAHAKERVQGRAIGAEEPSPIIEHPDVRRMLMTMKAYTEAMRGLIYDAVAADDRMHSAETEAEREAARDRLALLTPITKSWCTDHGVDVASIGVQVFGGMGFIEESGAPQFYRDARITPIYEGTNGIQALDLVMRKLPMRGGDVINGYLDEIDALGIRLAPDERLHDIATALTDAVAAVRGATAFLLDADPADAMAGATPYQEMLGTLAGGYCLARQAVVAVEGARDDPWLAAKVSTARFYAATILPLISGMAGAVTSGSHVLFAVDESFVGGAR